ncbi:MAG: GAF domain-containing protein [Dehalococcoidia bacterium]|nr:GAF domain-containing protein [Dehalococcoidia bacterium]
MPATSAVLREPAGGPETMFRAMAEAAPVMIRVTDEAGRCTWLNRNWLTFTGRTLNDETGDGWLWGVHPDDRSRVAAVSREHFEKRQAFDVEYRLRSAGGEWCWVFDRVAPIVLKDGDFAGFIGSCIDMSERKRAEEALRLLSDAGAYGTASLNPDETPARVARLIVERFADACTVTVLEADSSLRQVASAHRGGGGSPVPEWLSEFEPGEIEDDHAVARVIRSGEAELSTHDQRPDRTDSAESGRPASVAVVPLLARGRTIGAMACIRTDGSTGFDLADLTIAQELGRRAALAMDNGRLYRDEERANAALRLLADAGEQLASSLSRDDTLERLARLVVPRFADWFSIDILDPDGNVRHVAMHHEDPTMVRLATEVRDRYEPVSAPDPEMIKRLREGRPIFMPVVSDEWLADSAQDAEHLVLLRKLEVRSAMVVPLTAHGRTFGTISLARSTPGQEYDEADFAVAQQLGRRTALFVDNARLYTEAQRIETQLLKANEALRLLADVGVQLGSSLEYDEAVASLARLAVPAFSDACWVDILEEDGRVRRAAIQFRPGTDMRAVQSSRFGREPAVGTLRVIQTGEARLFANVTEADIAASTESPDHLAALRAMGVRSAMRLPLKARGRVFGAITFALGDGARRYTTADMALASDIANRGALFIDNARLYTRSQRTESDLRRANEAKDEFLSMMSHELRTPLTVINGGARILRSRGGQLDEKTQASIINDIELESDRLFRMVENLLAMAHIEFTEEVTIEPVLAQRLLDRVVESFRQRRPDRKVVLAVEPGMPALGAEPTYVEQVVRNLLSNADKYSPPGEEVEVRVERSGEQEATIRVRDRGVGVEPEEVERIFERFYRSARTSKLAGGSGVGLALCRRLVTAMSGRMWASPRDDGGLEVAFTLPLYEEAIA